MRITYDLEVDAAYIYLTERVMDPETVQIDDDINLDLDANDRLVGIEILADSERIDLDYLMPLVEKSPRRPVSWHRLKGELSRRKDAGEAVETLKQGVRNWVKEVGEDHIILTSEHPRAGRVRRITHRDLENSNLEDHKKHRRGAIVEALWKLGGYPNPRSAFTAG